MVLAEGMWWDKCKKSHRTPAQQHGVPALKAVLRLQATVLEAVPKPCPAGPAVLTAARLQGGAAVPP